MFESIVANIINRILGKYIDNLHSHQLTVGIWNGEVVLHNLILRKEALDSLDLPIEVVHGCIGEFILRIPWNSLKSKPIQVFMKHLYIIAGPKRSFSYNEQEELEKAFKLKMHLLEMSELLAAPIQVMMHENEKHASFAYHLVTKLVDNLQFHLDQLHIQYIDQEEKLCFGISIKSIQGSSANEQWQEEAFPSQSTVIRKLLVMDQFCIYSRPFSSIPSIDSITDYFESLDSSTFQYLLFPIGVSGQLTINKKSSPKYKLHMKFDDISLQLVHKQYIDMIQLSRSLDRIKSSHSLYSRSDRPQVQMEQDPVAWFQFSVRVIMDSINAKRRPYTSKYLIERRQNRKAYIALFKKKLIESRLNDDQQEQLLHLEKILAYDDIKTYRTMARYLVENTPRSASPAPTPSSWFSRFSFWSSTYSAEKEPEDQEFEQLCQTIDFDPNKVDITHLDQSFVKLDLTVSLIKGSLSLLMDDSTMIASLSLIGMNINCLSYGQSGASWKLLFNLNNFVLSNSQRDLIHPREELKSDDSAFFSLSYHHMAPEKKKTLDIDGSLNIISKPLCIVLDQTITTSVYDFFKKPLYHVPQMEKEFKSLTEVYTRSIKSKKFHLEVDFNLEDPKICLSSEPSIVLEMKKITLSSHPYITKKLELSITNMTLNEIILEPIDIMVSMTKQQCYQVISTINSNVSLSLTPMQWKSFTEWMNGTNSKSETIPMINVDMATGSVNSESDSDNEIFYDAPSILSSPMMVTSTAVWSLILKMENQFSLVLIDDSKKCLIKGNVLEIQADPYQCFFSINGLYLTDKNTVLLESFENSSILKGCLQYSQPSTPIGVQLELGHTKLYCYPDVIFDSFYYLAIKTFSSQSSGNPLNIILTIDLEECSLVLNKDDCILLKSRSDDIKALGIIINLNELNGFTKKHVNIHLAKYGHLVINSGNDTVLETLDDATLSIIYETFEKHDHKFPIVSKDSSFSEYQVISISGSEIAMSFIPNALRKLFQLSQSINEHFDINERLLLGDAYQIIPRLSYFNIESLSNVSINLADKTHYPLETFVLSFDELVCHNKPVHDLKSKFSIIMTGLTLLSVDISSVERIINPFQLDLDIIIPFNNDPMQIIVNTSPGLITSECLSRSHYTMTIERMLYLFDAIGKITQNDNANSPKSPNLLESTVNINEIEINASMFHISLHKSTLKFISREDESTDMIFQTKNIKIWTSDEHHYFFKSDVKEESLYYPLLVHFTKSNSSSLLKCQLSHPILVFHAFLFTQLKEYLLDGVPQSIYYYQDSPQEPQVIFISVSIPYGELYLVDSSHPSKGSLLSQDKKWIHITFKKLEYAKKDNFILSLENTIISWKDSDTQEHIIVDSFDSSLTLESQSGWFYLTPFMAKCSMQEIQSMMNLITNINPGTIGADDYDINPSIISDSDANSTNSITIDTKSTNTCDASQRIEVTFTTIRIVIVDNEMPMDILLEQTQPGYVLLYNDSSSLLDGTMHTRLSCYYLNIGNSAWEPLIEPWNIQCKYSRKPDSASKFINTVVDIRSNQSIQIVASHALLVQIANMGNKNIMYKEISNLVHGKDVASFLIRNRTGIPITLWDARLNNPDNNTSIVTLNNMEQLPWYFPEATSIAALRDPQKLETTASTLAHSICIHFTDSEWETIKNIPIHKQGTYCYPLRPKQNNVAHRFLVHIELDNNIKVVTFQSPMMIHNCTEYDIELLSTLQSNGNNMIKIKSNDNVGIPCQLAYHSSWKIRPLLNSTSKQQYAWSQKAICWNDVGNREFELVCHASLHSDALPLIFHISIVLDSQHSADYPLSYPMMHIYIYPPFILENLLPYAIKYRLIDKENRISFKGKIDMGSSVALHYITHTHLIGLGIEIEGYGYHSKDVAVVHHPTSGDLIDEEIDMIRDGNEGDELCLGIAYELLGIDVDKSLSISKRIMIYSPYVILDKTQLGLAFRPSSIFSQKVTTGNKNESFKATANNISQEKSIGSISNTLNLSDTIHPILFSYNNPVPIVKNRACIRINDNGIWSKPASFEAVGSSSELSLRKQVQSKCEWYNVGMTVQLGQGKSYRTRIVTFMPRYIIRNQLEEDIAIRHKSGTLNIIPGDGLIHFHFQDSESIEPAMSSLRRCTSEFDEWSGSFDLKQSGRFYIELRHGGTTSSNTTENKIDTYSDATINESHSYITMIRDLDSLLVQVDILLQNATIYTTLSPSNHWPFLLVNSSHFDIQAGQKHSKRIITLHSMTSVPFTWDMPWSSSGQKKLLSVTLCGKTRDICITEMGRLKPLKYYTPYQFKGKKKKKTFINVTIQGSPSTPTLVVTFSDDSKKEPFEASNQLSYDQLIDEMAKGSSTNIEGSETHSILDEDEEDTQSITADDLLSKPAIPIYEFSISIPGFGLSLLRTTSVGSGHHEEEFLYLHGKHVECHFKRTNLYDTLGLSLQWLQLDNQLDMDSNTVLYPTQVKQEMDQDTPPFLKIGLIRKSESDTIACFPYFGLLIQEVALDIEEDLLRNIEGYLSSFPMINHEEENFYEYCHGKNDIDESKQIMSSSNQGKMYFELFMLNPMRVELTFTKGVSLSADDTPGIHHDTGPIEFFINVMEMTLGNVHDAPLKFNALVLEHPIIDYSILLQLIKEHYTSQAVQQFHRLVGSADFLGNPIGLFSSFSSGVVDLFYEPWQGFVSEKPQDIGIGIAKGGMSLIKKTVYGISDTFGKVTESIGKGLSVTTLDDKFQRDRTRSMRKRRNRPRHAISGVATGAKSFAKSLVSGVVGVVEHPVEGAKENGVGGFFKGIGKGLVGAVTKPVVGAFDLASNISEGIKNTTVVLGNDDNLVDHIRLPRPIYMDGITRVYNERDALGQTWMLECDQDKLRTVYYPKDNKGNIDDTEHAAYNKKQPIYYITHLELDTERAVLIVHSHGVALLRHPLIKKGEILWRFSFANLSRISKGVNFVRFDLRYDRNADRRFVEITDDATREWFISKVNEAWKMFKLVFRSFEE